MTWTNFCICESWRTQQARWLQDPIIHHARATQSRGWHDRVVRCRGDIRAECGLLTRRGLVVLARYLVASQSGLEDRLEEEHCRQSPTPDDVDIARIDAARVVITISRLECSF